MRFVVSLAFKNLTRYKRRTLITAFAIAVGLMMFIIVDSLLMGAESESMRNLRWYETSSMRIVNAAYWPERTMLPLDKGIEHPQEILAQLRAKGLQATARIAFAADMMLYSEDFGEDGNLPVLVTAIDTVTDERVFALAKTLVDGRLLQPGEAGAVIGSWFAEDIGAKVGYTVTLLARGNGGFFEALDLEIVGIVNCPNPNVNRTLLMVPIDVAGQALGMGTSVTEIDIALPERADVAAEAKAWQRLLDPTGQLLKVVGWEELAKDYIGIAQAKRGGTKVLLFLVFIIAAVGISNTMLMAIYERVRELGMMRAMGMNDRSIQLAFMLEAGGIGLIGSIVGVLAGVVTNIPLVIMGVDFTFMMRDMDIGYRIQGIMRGSWNVPAIIMAFVAGFVLSMIAAYIPTRRALKMDIPACLRHN
jgi:ABC-type lipoprotein release transport system permease subunit